MKAYIGIKYHEDYRNRAIINDGKSDIIYLLLIKVPRGVL